MGGLIRIPKFRKFCHCLFDIYMYSTGNKNYGRCREVASFVRLPLQRIVRQGLKKLGRYSGRAGFLRVQFRKVSLDINQKVTISI
jgi:hypothetical protein